MPQHRRRLLPIGIVAVVVLVVLGVAFGRPAYDRLFLVQVDEAALTRTQEKVTALVPEIRRLDLGDEVRGPEVRVDRSCPVDSGQITRQPGLTATWLASDADAPTEAPSSLVDQLVEQGWTDEGPGPSSQGDRSVRAQKDGVPYRATIWATGSSVVLSVRATDEQPCTPGLLNSDERDPS